MANLITCPYCKEGDFDLIGLKHHLTYYCQVFKDTLTIEEWKKMHDIKVNQDPA